MPRWNSTSGWSGTVCSRERYIGSASSSRPCLCSSTARWKVWASPWELIAASCRDLDPGELALADLDQDLLSAPELQVPVAHLFAVDAHSALLDHARRFVRARHEPRVLQDLQDLDFAGRFLRDVLRQLAARACLEV